MKIPVTHRDDVTNLSRLEFTFTAEKGIGKIGEILLHSESGEVILGFMMTRCGDKLCLREMTAYGNHVMNLVEMDFDSVRKIKIEYFADENECHIYLDDKCVFVSNIFFDEQTRYDIPAYAIIKLSAGAVSLTVDNIKMERVNGICIKQEIDYTNPENDSEKLSFEYSGTGNLPLAINSSFNSPGAALTVVESPFDNPVGKALKFNTEQGGYDTVRIGATSSLEGASYIFESELCFGEDNLSSIYELSLMSGDAVGYRVSLYAYGNVVITENNHRPTDVDANVYKIAELGECFNLRLEYYIFTDGGAEQMRVKIFVNDTLLYVGEELYGTRPVVRPVLTHVELSATIGTSGALILDNLSFFSVDKAYEEE